MIGFFKANGYPPPFRPQVFILITFQSNWTIVFRTPGRIAILSIRKTKKLGTKDAVVVSILQGKGAPEKIAMTAPVVMTSKPEKMAMTAPAQGCVPLPPPLSVVQLPGWSKDRPPTWS